MTAERVGTAVAAAGCGVGAAAVGWAATATTWRTLALLLGVAGMVALAVTLLGRGPFLTAALLLLAAPAAVTLIGRRDEPTAVVVLAAALLFTTGELTGWSLDARSIVRPPRALRRRRVVTTAALGLGAAAVAGGVLAIGRLPAPGGVVPEVAGIVAASALVAFAALRRWEPDR